MRRLPEAELAVMQVLWEGEEALSRAEIEEQLQSRQWAATTLNTYLTRLLEKDFLLREKQGKSHYYRPKVEKSAYLAVESQAVLTNAFGSSLTNFIAALAGGGSLDEQQLQTAQEYLQELTRKEQAHD